MKNVKAILLAAGNCERFNGEVKQLLPVNGEPILKRTIRQLERLGVTNIITVAKHPEIKREVCNVFVPEEHKGVVGAIDASRQIWENAGEDTTILFLLSDVVWTDEAIKKVIETQTNCINYFGTQVENYAIKVLPEGLKQFKDCLNAVLFKKGTTSWNLYRTIIGLPIQRHIIEDVVHIVIKDKTDDIDHPQDYYSKVNSGYYADMGGATENKTVKKRRVKTDGKRKTRSVDTQEGTIENIEALPNNL